MMWRAPTRAGAPGLEGSPVGKRSSRGSAPRRSPLPISDSTTMSADRPPRKHRQTILDAIWRAVDLLIGIPQVRLGYSGVDEHPGWNISDEIDLPPRGECRYVVELACGQTASVRVAGIHPIAIKVCDDDDYDFCQDGDSPPISDSGVVTAMRDEPSVAFAFPAPRSGVYDLILSNPSGQSTHVAICITAPPARQAAKGPRLETGLRPLSAVLSGGTRATLKLRGRRP